MIVLRCVNVNWLVISYVDTFTKRRVLYYKPYDHPWNIFRNFCQILLTINLLLRNFIANALRLITNYDDLISDRSRFYISNTYVVDEYIPANGTCAYRRFILRCIRYLLSVQHSKDYYFLSIDHDGLSSRNGSSYLVTYE